MATYFQDYISDETGDLYVKNGDFVLAFSDDFHIENILRANPGNYLWHPKLGVGLMMLNTSIPNSVLETLITTQLSNDGYYVKQLNINDYPLPSQYKIDNLIINIEAYRP